MKVARTIFVPLLVVLSGYQARAQQLSCNQAQAAEEVRRLTDARTIVSVDVFLPDVTVVVEDRAWQRSPIEQKRAMAESINCATTGPNSRMLGTVLFRSSKTNKELAEYSHNQLTIE